MGNASKKQLKIKQNSSSFLLKNSNESNNNFLNSQINSKISGNFSSREILFEEREKNNQTKKKDYINFYKSLIKKKSLSLQKHSKEEKLILSNLTNNAVKFNEKVVLDKIKPKFKNSLEVLFFYII